MCKFCDENTPLARSLNGFPYPLLEIAKRKLDGKTVMLLSLAKDDHEPKHEIDIHFCPMCGKELNQENSSKPHKLIDEFNEMKNCPYHEDWHYCCRCDYEMICKWSNHYNKDLVKKHIENNKGK